MDYSVNRPIWPGSAVFVSGSSTPFGFFDSDPLFRAHAEKFAKFSANALGYPVMDVELDPTQFFTAFESAVIEYSNQVNQINIVNNLINTLGVQTASNYLTTGTLTDVNVGKTLGYVTKISKTYGDEADSGGDIEWRRAVINIIPGQQTYSIRQAVSESLGIVLTNTSSVEIKRVVHLSLIHI